MLKGPQANCMFSLWYNKGPWRICIVMPADGVDRFVVNVNKKNIQAAPFTDDKRSELCIIGINGKIFFVQFLAGMMQVKSVDAVEVQALVPIRGHIVLCRFSFLLHFIPNEFFFCDVL